MRYLYLDNFRGFSNALFQLRDVNFLVGENSTGKTSFLGLTKILSSPQFWFTQDFNIPEFEFGQYYDIANHGVKKKNYFRIGFFKKNRNLEPLIFVLLEFKEDRGIPKISQYYIQDKKRKTFGIVKKKEFFQKRVDQEFPQNMEASALFKEACEWFNVEDSPEKDQLKKLPGFFGRIPFFFQHTINSKSETIEFGNPMSYQLFEDLIWQAPIRSKPRRTYDNIKIDFSPEGEHIPYLIKDLLNSERAGEKFSNFLSDVGRKSGLFDNLEINQLGKDKFSPFELRVLINGHSNKLNNVGYGVSQSLPVFVEIFTRGKGSFYAIQQPEVHLHPKAQAEVGDLVFQMAKNEEKKFLIETHSDFIIDRFRYCLSKASENTITSQIIFFEKTSRGNRGTLIPISNNGKISCDPPKAFREFFLKEQLGLIGI